MPIRTIAGLLLVGAGLLALAAGSSIAGAQNAGDATVIHAGTLLSVPGEKPKTQQTIVVRDGKIVEVRDGYADAAAIGAEGARVVDLKDRFVLPGLIDSHVHLMGELGPRSRIKAMEDDPEDAVLDGAVYADRTLQAGFTTVRDLGSPARTSFALRDAINAGKVAGPTILAAGKMLSATAGHGDVNGMNADLTEFLHDLHGENVCDGADDCRRAVRTQVRNGADVIKLATTGGVLSNIAAGTGQQMTDEEVKAIVDAGHTLGKKVAAHAHGTPGINSALRAGIDSIEHGSYLDDESLKLFRQSGAWLVPTLLAGDTVARMAAASSNTLTQAQRDKAAQVGPIMQQNFARAVQAGVKIAFGTDSGVSAHGQNAKEFKLMADAGMKPADAVKSATVGAATLLDRSASIGTIEAGKDADIIAVTGNPLEDVTVLEAMDFVMRRGTIHRQNGERQAFTPGS